MADTTIDTYFENNNLDPTLKMISHFINFGNNTPTPCPIYTNSKFKVHKPIFSKIQIMLNRESIKILRLL